MSVLRLSPSDLARVRLAVSPVWETVASRRVLRRPGASPRHRRWVTAAARADTAASFADHKRLLDAVVRPGSPVPDFLTPPPTVAVPDVETELAVVAATAPEVVHADIVAAAGRRAPTRLARRVADDPVTWLPSLVEAVRVWHRLTIADHWPRMQAHLESDIAFRAATLAEQGPGRMLESIHPSLHWRDDGLVVDDGQDLDLVVGGRGLSLVPSLFFLHPPVLALHPGSPPQIVYTARAAGSLWETRHTPPADAALAALLGASRARILAILEAPATTTAIAVRLGLAPAAVSAHLKVLHRSGLTSRHRHGREVFYVLTDLGRRLLGFRD